MASRNAITKFIQKLLSYNNKNAAGEESDEIRRFISATEEAQLLQAIEHAATHSEDQLVSLVKIICGGLSNESSASRVKRKKIIRTLIELLRESRLENNIASGILLLIFSEIDILTAPDLLELLVHYKKAFEREMQKDVETKYIEVFPKLLNRLSSVEKADPHDENELTGRQLRDQFLKDFCYRHCDVDVSTRVADGRVSAKWHKSAVAHILRALKDATLSAEEKNWIVLKTLDLFSETDLDDLPNVVYELLALAREGDKSLAINGIINFFAEIDKSKMDEDENNDHGGSSAEEWNALRNSEGIVMLHIMHAVRQHRDTGPLLLNIFKAKSRDLRLPFSFGLLLAVSQVSSKIKEQSLEIAKTKILQYFKEREKREKSCWMESILRMDVKFGYAVTSLTRSSEIGMGWKYALIGLRELGFTLIETHLPKIIILSNGKLAPDSPNSVGFNACRLGERMLYKCFTAFSPELRQTIIKRLFDLITMAPPNAHSSALFFIDVLSGLVSRGGATFLACEEKLAEIFELATTLASDIGIPLIKSLIPLIKVKVELRDAMIMALKKALFSRNLESKKTAVGGLLLFLKHFKIMNAFKPASGRSDRSTYWHSFPTFGSQALSDSRTDPQRASYERLCLEVIGCLRRILLHQGELKEVLYRGFCSVVRRNESTLQPVVDFLFRHLQDYLETDPDVKPPFHLDSCVQVTAQDSVSLMEPFGHLIHILARLLKKADVDYAKLTNGGDGDDGNGLENLYFDQNAIQRVRTVLLDLAKRIGDCEMEDFGIDKFSDFSPSSTGESNVKKGLTLLSTYAALIELIWSFYDFSADSADLLLSLHSRYANLKNLLLEKAKTKGKKAAATTNQTSKSQPGMLDELASTDVPTVDISTLLDLLDHLILDQSPRRQEGLRGLRNKTDFIRWIFQVTLAKIKSLSSRRKIETSKNFGIICKISKLMNQFYDGREEIVNEMKRPLMDLLKPTALEIIGGVLEIVNLQFGEKIEDAVNIWTSDLDEENQGTPENVVAKLYAYMGMFREQLKQILALRAEAPPTRKKAANNSADNDGVQEDGDTADERSPTRVLTLIRIIELISKHFAPKSDQFKAVYGFLLEICQEQTIREPVVAKSLWQMLLKMNRRLDADEDLALALSKNIRFQFGDINADGGERVEPETIYASITERTANAVATVLFSHIEEWRDDCAFLIERVKRDQTLAKLRKESSWTPNEAMDDGVCKSLDALANVWRELAKSELPDTQIQSAIKMLQPFFTTCTSFVRYYSQLHQTKMGELTPAFIDFANSLGSDLVMVVSKFIIDAKCSMNQALGANGKQNAAKARQALREVKDVPYLVFAIEKYEECLIALSNKTKEKKLIRRLHFGHSRDFRINCEKFERAHKVANGESDAVEAENDVTIVPPHMVEESEEMIPQNLTNAEPTAAPKKRKAGKAATGATKQKKKKSDVY